MANAQDYQVQDRQINGTPVKVTSYRLDEAYYCQVANADPGATIARAEGATRQQALDAALSKATEKLEW